MGSGSERPHDSCLQHTAAVERHRPARKGLRQTERRNNAFGLAVERHRPARKGLRHVFYATFATQLEVERHRPARKGLRPSNSRCAALYFVERHRPARKGLRREDW